MIAKDFSYVDEVEFQNSLNDKEKFRTLIASLNDVKPPVNHYILANIYFLGGLAVKQELVSAYENYRLMMDHLFQEKISEQQKDPLREACLFIIQNFTEINKPEAAEYAFYAAFLLEEEDLLNYYFDTLAVSLDDISFSSTALSAINSKGETIAHALCHYWHDISVEKMLSVLDSLKESGVELNPDHCQNSLIDIVVKHWMASGRTLDDTVFMIGELSKRDISLNFSTMRLIGEFPFGRDSFRSLMLILNDEPFNLTIQNKKFVAQSYLCHHASLDDLESIQALGVEYSDYVLRTAMRSCKDALVFEHILQHNSGKDVMTHGWACLTKLDSQPQKLKILLAKLLQSISTESLGIIFDHMHGSDGKRFDILLQSVCETSDIELLDKLGKCCELYPTAKRKVQREKILLCLKDANADYEALLGLREVQEHDLLEELIAVKQLYHNQKLDEAVDKAEKLIQKTLENPTNFDKKIKRFAFSLLQVMANNSVRAAEFTMKKFIANKQMEQASQWFDSLDSKNNPAVRFKIGKLCYESEQHEFAAEYLGSVFSCFEMAKKLERAHQDRWPQQVAGWYCKAIMLAPEELESTKKTMYSLRVLKEKILIDPSSYAKILEVAIELIDSKLYDQQKELQCFIVDFKCELLFTKRAILPKEEATSWLDTYITREYVTQYAIAYLFLLDDVRFENRVKMIHDGMRLNPATVEFYKKLVEGRTSSPKLFHCIKERAEKVLMAVRRPCDQPYHLSLDPSSSSQHPELDPGSSSGHPGLDLGSSPRRPGLDPGSSSRHPGLDPGSSSRHPGLDPGSSSRHPGLDPGSRK